MTEVFEKEADIAPEQIVEDMLWAFGAEKPKCREIIGELIFYLRKRVSTMDSSNMSMITTPTLNPDELRQLRKSRSMTQRQLADLLGCSIQMISLVETGCRRFGYDTYIKLLNVFGIDAKDTSIQPKESKERYLG